MGKRGTLIIVETSIEFNGSKCQTYAHADGSYYSRGGGKIMARRHLTDANRPPNAKEVCRHKCNNDSTAPNGFVCCNPDHLTWGTQQENLADRTPEARAAGGKAGGSKGGKAAALVGAQSKAGKMPTAGTQTQSQCRHCKKWGQRAAMGRWHFDNCRSLLWQHQELQVSI